MKLKYIDGKYYIGSQGQAIAEMEYIGQSVFPVVIAESNAEWNSLRSGTGYITNEETYAAFVRNTGIEPSTIVIPAFFHNSSQLNGYTSFGDMSLLPNLVGYPIGGSSSDRTLICSFMNDSYYYMIGDIYAEPSTIIQISAAAYAIYDGQGNEIAGGLLATGAFNNQSTRSQNHILILKSDGTSIVGYSQIYYTLSETTGRYSATGNYTSQSVLEILNQIAYIDPTKDISTFDMTLSPESFYFDGNEHYPNVSIVDNLGNYLRYNTDYILSWSPDVINPGTKIVLAIGQGEYSGELQGTWTVLEGVDDPYSPGGTTVPSTGPTDGSWQLPADDLAVGGSPFNDLATQLYRPYAMTAAQVASFSNQLWNTDILDVISRYFEKPTEVVISLMSFPFTVECENSVQINFNWISSWSSVYVLGHPITQEIQSLDFGYVDLERYSGLFYDYQPYSSVQLYLPYIGFVPLKMNEVVGKRIRLTYLVDVLSGDFTAVVETSALGTPEPEKTLPYIGFYQGNIARPMPLSQQDLFSLFKKGTEIAITGAVAATAGTVGAIEGLAAEKAVGEAVQFTEQGLPQAAEMAMGRAATSQAQSQSAYKTFRRFGAATAANSILSIGNASAPILRNGTIDGISGRTSGQEAFIVITVPNQNVPENQRILGYPTNQPGPLSKFSGYTEVRDIRLKIPNATESEIAEIESIVRGGIVI